jgi:WD40 repeat protein
MKDVKVSCLEFLCSRSRADRGHIVWVGTREGHLFEMDARIKSVRAVKHVAHTHTVTHIFRHRDTMITADQTGKVLIFSPQSNGEDVQLAYTQPRVFRITEKQDFTKMLGGLLWTSVRSDPTVNEKKGPIIRVYDVFSPGSVGRSLFTGEPTGAVLAGALLPSQPGCVYLGHEAGIVSIWTLETEDKCPQCMEIVKVSTSDVLCLEGVNGRLWAGGRNGIISTYDVSNKPWVVTSSWAAHTGLPVTKITTDPYSIDRCGMLCVLSVGRDEQMRLWDGLLGTEWTGWSILSRIEINVLTRASS